MSLHLSGVPTKFARPSRNRPNRSQLSVHELECRSVPAAATAYIATDLVSDQAGVAPITDPNLVNGWGISRSPTFGGFWVSSNGAGLSTIYTGDVNGSALSKAGLEVTIPGGAPTGQVFNPTTDFVVTNGAQSAPALFIFAGEDGVVSGWSNLVPPTTTAKAAFTATDGSIYKGIALGNNGTANFLYLADFHNNQVDVLDSTFHLTTLAGNFTDPNLPAGYAPFNVAVINDKLYVAYAKQDAAREDEIAGAGLGFVDVFDLNGNFQQRLASRGVLNAPWAVVQAPANFGDFSGDLLVGNFGDGKINAFDPATGAFQGTLSSSPGHPIVIDGLWGLTFGNGLTAGDTTTLYYAAGPDDETHGLFGKITANPAGTLAVTATLSNGTLVVTGSRDNDQVMVKLAKGDQQVVVRAGGKTVGTFNLADVGTIEFNGMAGNDRIQIANQLGVTAVLNGGAGNDMLIGGGGNNVLVGGTGNDKLFGQSGRDLLIGGDGLDRLLGRGNDDILIGGSTAHDGNTSELLQILDEWTSTDSYTTRVNNLRAGTGGLPALNGTNVADDGLRDFLLGGAGLDWFFAGLQDLMPGKLSAEQLN
jgi:uncharacterized protein (TIGR03118 family)